jgi:hypothetical protein
MLNGSLLPRHGVLYNADLAPCNFSVFRHFDIVSTIEAESQAVLNTLTEHYFQIHLTFAQALGILRGR